MSSVFHLHPTINIASPCPCSISSRSNQYFAGSTGDRRQRLGVDQWKKDHRPRMGRPDYDSRVQLKRHRTRQRGGDHGTENRIAEGLSVGGMVKDWKSLSEID